MILLVADIPPTMGLILAAAIAIIPSTLGAYWAHNAKINSQHAKNSSALALHEVQTNGGMSDPNPNLNDHVKYQTEMLENVLRTQNSLTNNFGILADTMVDVDGRLTEHLEHSKVMDTALTEVYTELKGMPPKRST